jgi:signal transduction histidine kinase
MVLATVVLAAVLVTHQEMRLRDVLGRALLAEAHGSGLPARPVVPGTDWWIVAPDGGVRTRSSPGAAIDVEARTLAGDARTRSLPLLWEGAVWEEIRFAAPLGGGQVAVARLPRSASWRLRAAPLGIAGSVLLVDVVIFTALGAYLLRRRVVRPLTRLAAVAESIAAGDRGARALEEGPRESAQLAGAFNGMLDALDRRSEALLKAVGDLRSANQDLRRARDGLDRAERLASVGRLAAGVSHEVGNPMAAMLAFLHLVSRDDGLKPDSREHLGRALEQGERVRRILRQLLDFSRPSRGSPAPLDLAEAARETVALVQAQHRYSNLDFRVVCDGPAPLGWADPGALAQVLLNLVLNAADAACDADPARVELRVAAVPLRVRLGEPANASRARARFDAVECVVCDTGHGIAEEDRERIFDPFFTTKPPGQGTGLGLANALVLAEQQAGSLRIVQAPEGFRTAFTLRVPCAPAKPSAEPRRTHEQA